MWPNMNYRNFGNDLKKKTYQFQCKMAGKRKNRR